MHLEAEAEAALEVEEAQGVASAVRREGLVASAVEGEARLGVEEEGTDVILPGFGVLRTTWFMALRMILTCRRVPDIVWLQTRFYSVRLR